MRPPLNKEIVLSVSIATTPPVNVIVGNGGLGEDEVKYFEVLQW